MEYKFNLQKFFEIVFNYFLSHKYFLSIPLISIVILYLHYINFLTYSFPDEYNSYVRAYFMDHGRGLYSEIFSHHNPLMVYFSYGIQKLLTLSSIYELVLVHRMSVAIFSLVMAALLIYRFKWPAVGFVVVIEFVKYYLFGNLFLAESFVMYFLVYLFGLAWEKFHKNKISNVDLLLGGLCLFLITFLREPLIPPAAVLYVYIFFDKSRIQLKILIALVLALLSFLLIMTVDFSEYYYHLITLNFSGYIQEELETQGGGILGLLKIFFYPLYILIAGKSGDFRWVLIILDVLFLASLGIYIRQKKYVLAAALIFVLGLANIRYSEPGETFFNVFHMLPWFGLFVFSIFLMIQKMSDLPHFKYMRLAVIASTGIVILIALLPPYSIIYRPHSVKDEYSINYSRFFIHGEVVRRLSNKDDTLFADYWDTLVSWQSGLDSPYQYAMFFPVMSTIEKYTTPYDEMFKKNPPNFYYVDCDRPNPYTNEKIFDDYSKLEYDEEDTCLYIHNEKLKEITSEQWSSVEEIGYSLKK